MILTATTHDSAAAIRDVTKLTSACCNPICKSITRNDADKQREQIQKQSGFPFTSNMLKQGHPSTQSNSTTANLLDFETCIDVHDDWHSAAL